MSKQVLGSSFYRLGGLGALFGVVVGCNAVEIGSSGHLEVLPRPSESVACEAVVAGQLRIEGVVAAESIRISSEELCRGRTVRHELPAGLYSVTWQPSPVSADADEKGAANGVPEDHLEDDGEARWTLRGPSIVSVFPGQLTRIRVVQAAPERELASRVP
jgi:hypothetical protein